jgi:hypothetical protein
MPEMPSFLQDIFKKFHFLKPFSFTFFLSLLVITNGCTNFHEVTPGVLYRSKQLSGSQFDHFIKKFKIKTVINLRGAAPDDKWYREETKTTQANNAAHWDIHFSAVCYVPPKKVDSIMSIATAAAKPILVLHMRHLVQETIPLFPIYRRTSCIRMLSHYLPA